MAPFIIGGLIALYVVFVIVRRVKAVKAGHYCNCSCDNCPSGCNAMKSKKKEI